MTLPIFNMMRLVVSIRACFSIRGKYVTHMKFREIPGIAWFRYIGQSDLHIPYYWLLHVWYTPGRQQV